MHRTERNCIAAQPTYLNHFGYHMIICYHGLPSFVERRQPMFVSTQEIAFQGGYSNTTCVAMGKAGLQVKTACDLQSWSLSSSKWSIKQQKTPDFCQNQQTKTTSNSLLLPKSHHAFPIPLAFCASGAGALAIFGVDSCGGGLVSASSSTISTGRRGGAWDRSPVSPFHRVSPVEWWSWFIFMESENQISNKMEVKCVVISSILEHFDHFNFS